MDLIGTVQKPFAVQSIEIYGSFQLVAMVTIFYQNGRL